MHRMNHIFHAYVAASLLANRWPSAGMCAMRKALAKGAGGKGPSHIAGRLRAMPSHVS